MSTPIDKKQQPQALRDATQDEGGIEHFKSRVEDSTHDSLEPKTCTNATTTCTDTFVSTLFVKDPIVEKEIIRLGRSEEDPPIIIGWNAKGLEEFNSLRPAPVLLNGPAFGG